MLGSKVTVYTDNNLLAYIQMKLGASQICWLSELALFDFNIVYRLGRTKKAADAWSQCPAEPTCKLESKSDNNSEDPVMLSYATICGFIKLVLGDTKIPFVWKKEVQEIGNALEGKISATVCEYPPLLFRLVQSQFSIRCHQPLLLKHKPKILYWDWSFHMCIREETKGLSHFQN